MGRYIEADALLESVKSKRLIFEESTPVEEAIAEQVSVFEEAIEEAPTADVVAEIFEKIEKRLAMYSHLHKYAEEAREITEEYADGTPCEMTSVWDVLSLHKNGWDDYETMNKLQDNIGNIEKSRLLKELEDDIAEIKKEHTEAKKK